MTTRSVFWALGRVGMLIGFYWFITQKQFDWLLYIAIPLMVLSIVLVPAIDWKAGRKKEARMQLITAALVLVAFAVLMMVRS